MAWLRGTIRVLNLWGWFLGLWMTSSTDCCFTTTHSPSRSRAGECVWMSPNRWESGCMPKPSANAFGFPPASFSSHPSSHVFKGLKEGDGSQVLLSTQSFFCTSSQSHCFSRTSPGHRVSYGSKLRKHLNQKTVGRASEGCYHLLYWWWNRSPTNTMIFFQFLDQYIWCEKI